MTPKILTCGHPKSGLYLTVRVVALLLEGRGLLRSYKKETGLDRVIDEELAENKIFPEISWLDHVRTFQAHFRNMWPELQAQRFFLGWPDPKRPFHVAPIADVVAGSSLLWSSLEPRDTLHDDFRDVTHRVCSVRDGRDVAVSYLHYITSDIMNRLGPANRALGSSADALANLDKFAELASTWSRSVKQVLAMRSSFLVVRFEDLVADKAGEVERIGRALGLDPTPEEVEGIVTRTTPAATAGHAPKHLRKGVAGDWRNHFTDAHVAIFKQVAGDALIDAGYETGHDWSLEESTVPLAS